MYSIKELSELAGVSKRTLRYYDEIGLLKPKRHLGSGYRIYEEKEVDLLQQILFYKAMDMSLERIQEIMKTSDFEIAKALKEHHQQLLLKKEQLDQLILTVEKTMANRRGEISMSNKEKFEGFKKEKIAENEQKYGLEIRKKYGDEIVDQSNEKFKGLSEEEYHLMQKIEEELFTALKQVELTRNLDSDLAKEVFQKHKQWLMFYWSTYSREAHRGLAQMYLADERFGEYYDNRAGVAVVDLLVKIIMKYA